MYRYDNNDFYNERYTTPKSFRRTKESEEIKRKCLEEQQERESLNSDFNQYHQTDDNNVEEDKMSNQVFGSRPEYNYPSDKPEPLDGREYFTQNKYESPRHEQGRYQQQSYDSPRHQYGQQDRNQQQQVEQTYYDPRQNYIYGVQNYRSGRPDLGFQSDDRDFHVPYPQEPIRRRREYEQPPDIGYQNSSEGEAQRSHPGWVLLLRFHRDGDKEVRRALTMCAKHIDGDSGRILGIASPRSIHIREGGEGWVKYGRMRYAAGGRLEVQDNPMGETLNYCVLALYYPSLSRAIQWFDRDSCFKHKDFPARGTVDCIALPLNSSVDTKFCKTLVLTEYPKITHPEYFRDKFSIPTEDMLRTRFRASPYVVKATSLATDDIRKRVARHLRGYWLKSNSIITLSLFDSKEESNRYFTDPEYYKHKSAQDKVSAPTTVVMDLQDWHL